MNTIPTLYDRLTPEARTKVLSISDYETQSSVVRLLQLHHYVTTVTVGGMNTILTALNMPLTFADFCVLFYDLADYHIMQALDASDIEYHRI